MALIIHWILVLQLFSFTVGTVSSNSLIRYAEKQERNWKGANGEPQATKKLEAGQHFDLRVKYQGKDQGRQHGKDTNSHFNALAFKTVNNNLSSSTLSSKQFLDETQDFTTSPSDSVVGHSEDVKENLYLSAYKTDHDILSHGDKFRCPPCDCLHSFSLKIIANCSFQGLHQIPQGLPHELWQLNMTRNALKTFSATSLQNYTYLAIVRIAHNSRLTEIKNESLGNETTIITHLDLSHNSIRSVDDGSFIVMPELENLTISNNYLKVITNDTFKGLLRLIYLNLAFNKIWRIEYGAFDHMTDLKMLDLSFNFYLGYDKKHISPQMFSHLRKVRFLYLQGSKTTLNKYPNEALQQLVNLQVLAIDGIRNGVFGSELKALKYLQELQIGYSNPCNLREIPENYFENIPHITKFSVSRCKLNHVNPNAYIRAKNLFSLSFSYLANYDLFTAFDDLKGLQNSSVLILKFIHLYHSTPPCRQLASKQAMYLQHMRLEELDLTDNRLALLQEDFTFLLPKTLKRLILRNNRLTLLGFNLNRIVHLEKLWMVDLTMQNREGNEHLKREVSAASDLRCSHCSNRESRNRKMISLEPSDESCHSISVNQERIEIPCQDAKSEEKMNLRNKNTIQYRLTKRRLNSKRKLPTELPIWHYLNIPPNLRILQASQYVDFGHVLLFHHVAKRNSLRDIDFSKSFISDWGSGFLPSGIEKVDLHKNYCNRIHNKFFLRNNSVVFLSLSDNFLANDFANDTDGKIFSELNKAYFLDISKNLIYKLPEHFLKGLSSLKTLKLSDNKLQVLQTRFNYTKSLSFLDVSRNSITWITEQVRDDLDMIAASNDLRIDLTMNPLPCTCEGITVLKWMATTKVHLLNADYLKCRFSNGVVADIKNLQDRVKSLQQQCASKSLILVICVASIAVVGVTICFGFMYRYRWKLRYLRYVKMGKMFGFQPREKVDSEFKFDAYFLYTDETTRFVRKDCVRELEEKRGHKLCIEDREYLPGTDMLGSIVSAIQNSRKTIPVVTPEFYDNDFSEFRIKMAMMEEVYKSRSVLHLCMYQQVPEDQLSHDFLTVLNRNHYTEFPPDEKDSDELMENFWDQLSQVIGHSLREEGDQ